MPDTSQPSQETRPNILIIMADQHRADLMTCEGNHLVPTPNMDRIAERGVRFTNAYCPYPVCVASRMSLLTGLYAHSTGAIDNEDFLDWRYRTMAHHFGEHGYLTALLGKMHFRDAHNHGFEYYLSIDDWMMYLGPKVQHWADEIANHPLGQHFFDTVHDHGAGLPDVCDLWDGPNNWVGNVDRWDFEAMACMASPLEAEDQLDSFLARESVKFMRRYRDQPFLLVTSFMKPHSPFYAPREWAEKYPIADMDLPPVGDTSQYPEHIRRRIHGNQSQSERRLKAHRAGYLANLAFVDTCVGAVLDGLDESGLRGNTIIVYTSDHGEMDGDHGLNQKFVLFEPAVRVPLIVSYPKHLSEAAVTSALTEQLGLYPTLCDLADIPQPTDTTLHGFPGAARTMDAQSFADVLRDPTTAGPPAAFSEHALRAPVQQYMIRTRQWKYIHNRGGDLHELYDHGTDPGENVNLAREPAYAGQCEELREQLFGWHDPEANHYRPR